jgi:hypothetical protein
VYGAVGVNATVIDHYRWKRNEEIIRRKKLDDKTGCGAAKVSLELHYVNSGLIDWEQSRNDLHSVLIDGRDTTTDTRVVPLNEEVIEKADRHLTVG